MEQILPLEMIDRWRVNESACVLSKRNPLTGVRALITAPCSLEPITITLPSPLLLYPRSGLFIQDFSEKFDLKFLSPQCTIYFRAFS
jgi:hypothetical protein